MDNKKWYNRFATIFWWSLAILPLLFIVVTLIGTVANFNTLGGTSATAITLSDTFSTVLANAFTNISFFENLTIPALSDTFSGLANVLSIPNPTVFGIIFGYMLSVNVYHVIFDVLVWLPHKAHCLMED